MAVARLFKTLFLPGLFGQYKLWDGEIKNIVQKVDEIVSLGNLVGCTEYGKDSADRGPNQAVLERVHIWRYTYDAWFQVIGPHEVMALNFPDLWTNKSSGRMLRNRWFNDYGRYKVAVVNKGRLVTAGGLTYGQWKEIGSPSSAEDAAAALNDRYEGKLYFGKSYRAGDAPQMSADPIFADPLIETYVSWILAGEPMPFNQVHGNNSLNSVDGYDLMHGDFSYLKFLKRFRFFPYGASAELPAGGEFLGVHFDTDFNEPMKYLPYPWNFYIETTPVLDHREEMFEDPKKTKDKKAEESESE